MDEFLHFVVQQLVEHPDEAVLTHRVRDGKILYQLSLHESDVGHLIGKGGHTINAIRELLNAAAERQGMKVALEILE